MPVDNLQNAQEQQRPESHWQQGSLVDLEITDLSPTGDGVGRWGNQNLVVFVPNTVPGDHITVRLIRVKPRYAHGQLQSIKQASPHRVRPQCIVADKCGGCQWQQVDYAYQLVAKQNHVIQALERIGKFQSPVVEPVLAAPSPIEYRNKVTYPIVLSPNTNRVQAGYYRKGSHKLINLNQCPVQDPHFNSFLAEIKEDIQKQDWPIYNEQNHRGLIRHLSIRIGRRTGEILMTLIINAKPNQSLSELVDLDAQVQEWLERYPRLVGISLNFNPHRTNRIFGHDSTCIAGHHYLQETFAGLTFQLRHDTFFQVHTEQAEVLLNTLFDHLQLMGSEQVVDLYCGIGTLTLPLAQRVKEIIGIELQAAAVDQAQTNATLNQISNVTFAAGTAKACLRELPFVPDLVLLDPPRKGCHQSVIEQLLALKPAQIVYVSCHSATLARDLNLLCQSGQYDLTRVQPVDFFPQTSHVECVAFLNRRAS
ncbi:23S rRNA (uracil(1939)-C(5))-methyltransferase RlmD [Acaryochloris marina]|uniref:23S rRNA (Uracil-5-)-methyltransferase RumA n=1 Tax=Acaryochloris marina (strain MBIC 11017) TaxID=329726 RepID=B0C9S9_ACAM1|nr:23S rRNA (uracil(1939)-C(5))-methyltransferase RlmD [Acaryochloris marina]ABW30227.1 23S rRNA (uracil-5-)-methyltransferase RumA [Acaryochloris marina MBIC11017]BDM79065.1 putative RNA methyltransferase [Acaryochloris marina MBIC10699]